MEVSQSNIKDSQERAKSKKNKQRKKVVVNHIVKKKKVAVLKGKTNEGMDLESLVLGKNFSES